MKYGYLSEYFEGVAAKLLSAVEADEARSNQHEFNATKAMLSFLGRPADRRVFDARYLYMADEDDASLVEDASLTLYDSRASHATRTEYRLYFPETRVSKNASEGDLLVIAKARDGKLLVIIAEANSTISSQVLWLFGLTGEIGNGFLVRTEFDEESSRVGFAAASILESMGIVVEVHDSHFLDQLLGAFKNGFPRSAEFSAFARTTLPEVESRSDPDSALIAWMQREELLFRQLEKHLISARLDAGFSTVDDFIAFSLSVQNRRKARVGLALENHVEAVLLALELSFKRSARTENKSKPDFLFPGERAYQDATFSTAKLTMLATKSTCKDRWRQVLAEADRIEEKHLLTLETAISCAQTSEMSAKQLRLVVPRALHVTYAQDQQRWLLDLSGFLDIVAARQRVVGR